MSLLSIQNMSVTIDSYHGQLQAVRQMNLSLQSGEVLGIVGESGCGKSIAMLSLLRLLPKSAHCHADEIHFDGQDINRLSERDMRQLRGNDIGVIFQDPMTALNPAYTIGNQLTEVYIHHRQASRREAEDRAISLLEKVGISSAKERLHQYPHQLSGGLRQRVVIAQALMCAPKLIIADEPTTALDVTIQAQILALLKEMQKDTGAAVILITHDIAVVAQLSSRISVMYAGGIVETGSTQAVLTNSQHPYTKGLLSCLPDGQRGKTLGQIKGSVPSLIGAFEGCSFRTRCEFAKTACRGAVPARQHSPEHRSHCVLESVISDT